MPSVAPPVSVVLPDRPGSLTNSPPFIAEDHSMGHRAHHSAESGASRPGDPPNTWAQISRIPLIAPKAPNLDRLAKTRYKTLALRPCGGLGARGPARRVQSHSHGVHRQHLPEPYGRGAPCATAQDAWVFGHGRVSRYGGTGRTPSRSNGSDPPG